MRALIEQHTEEVKSQLDELGRMDAGSDEYVETVKAINTLTKDIVDLEKLLAEKERMEKEHEEKTEVLKAENKDRVWKNLIAVTGIVLPLGIAIWANVYNWNKEETDTMTRSGGKKAMEFLQRFKSK